MLLYLVGFLLILNYDAWNRELKIYRRFHFSKAIQTSCTAHRVNGQRRFLPQVKQPPGVKLTTHLVLMMSFKLRSKCSYISNSTTRTGNTRETLGEVNK